jgi:hypothetical protein
MALTAIQRDVCRLLAGSRIASGESYVAGGVALNELLSAPRRSRDIDLFHDTDEALRASWDQDRLLLVTGGFAVTVIRERWRLIGFPGESRPLHDALWRYAGAKSFAFRRLYDTRTALTLTAQGVTELATVNVKDFESLGFDKVWNPLA